MQVSCQPFVVDMLEMRKRSWHIRVGGKVAYWNLALVLFCLFYN